ncbi:MAG: helix-turn-helix domain-containing protein [Candidatus Nitrospinota bacterium M3_3B_026]
MNIPESARERREWIKYQLRLRGDNLASIAREMGVSRHASILALRKPYPRMERAIAGKLGMSPSALWPERYDSNGTPNRRRGRPRSSGERNNLPNHVDKDSTNIIDGRNHKKR